MVIHGDGKGFRWITLFNIEETDCDYISSGIAEVGVSSLGGWSLEKD